MNKSLKYKITIPVIVIVFLLLVVMVVTSLYISSRQIGRIAEEKGRAISVIQSEGLQALLTFEDKDGIKNSLKSLTKDPAIVSAQVLNVKGETLGEVGEKYALAKTDTPREDLQIKKAEIGKRTCQVFRYRIRDAEKKEMGTLVIAMSLETLNAANRSIALALVMIGLIALLVVGLVLMLLINRTIKPLIESSRLMEELASGEGDLTVRLDVQTNDEIGKMSDNFNNFVEKIRQIIVKVKESADSTLQSTGEITSSSEDLATRTNEQAASITETSTTLEQFTSIVRRNSQNSEEVSTSLKSFNAEIQTKKSLMDNVTSTMREIDDSSKKIDNIINVINDISFQTNLLALNAAVEAARAGEAGRGFAVVASEVRNLAQKTAESSKTIQEIVTRNVESTKKGMELVGETSAFFSTIVKVMENTVNKIVLITEGSREQSTGIEQINSAIAQLESVINQNAALVEELAAAGKTMKTSTGDMHELVAQFKVEEEG